MTNYLQQRKKWLALMLVFVPLVVSAQNDSAMKYVQRPVRKPVRNIAWFTPCNARQINGLALGLQVINFRDQKMAISGLNVSAGAMTLLLAPYVLGYGLAKPPDPSIKPVQGDSSATVIRGLSLSAGGEMNISVKGVNIAGFATGGYELNGLSLTGVLTKTWSFKGICISGLANKAERGIGLQIGLFNSCKDLKGVQVGLWNKSGRRGLPLMNWGT